MNTLPSFLQLNSKHRAITLMDEAMESYRLFLATWLIEMTLLLGWYRQLLEECSMKGGQTGKMGFMTS
ncbi:MAG: hypothetical protein Q8O64_16830 [Sideroxyarcus sp.]|nr:hypothetical protein [Sideroxyarcus sp.]